MALSKTNLENLSKLAKYLKYKVKASQFDMEVFRGFKNRNNPEAVLRATDFQSVSNCGTHGCALGWAPFCIPTKASDYDQVPPNIYQRHYTTRLDFHRYSDRIFKLSQRQWTYLFGSAWGLDPKSKTKTAAVKRIETLVKSEGRLTDAIKADLRKLDRLIIAYNY